MAGQSKPVSTTTTVLVFTVCSSCQRLSSCHGNCWALLQTQSRASEVRYQTLELNKRKGENKDYTCNRSPAPMTKIAFLKSDFCLCLCKRRLFLSGIVHQYHLLVPGERRLQILSYKAAEGGWVGNVITRNAPSPLIHSFSYIFQHLPRTYLCLASCQVLGLQREMSRSLPPNKINNNN